MLWGLVIFTIISSIGAIFIARLLGSNLYGLYGIALVTPGLISIFSDWEMNSAIIRFTAQYKLESRIEEIRSIFASGVIFEVALDSSLWIMSLDLSFN